MLRDLDKLDSAESLSAFMELSWHILEPENPYSRGWHLKAICDHLQAISNGHITRLLINVPPGFTKSLTTSVFWPAFEWGPRKRPDLRYVLSSYSEDLTIRDNRRCKNLIKSKWYQDLWGDVVQLDPEQDSKMRYDTMKRGYRIATSTGGLGTGERGDRFIIDDPHNIKDGESEPKMKSTLQWFSEVVPTRLNNPSKSAIIVIMQRVHTNDVSGHILEKELGYEHLMLPMEFEPKRKCVISVTHFEDPRTEEGELLWKDRFPRDVVERDKKALGTYATAGQFQQRPAPRGGGMFKRENFIKVLDWARTGTVVRSWDLAAGDEATSDWTVGLKMRRTRDHRVIIEDVVRFRLSPGKVEDKIKETALKDGYSVEIDFPQDPGQAGKSQKRYLAGQLHGFLVHFSPESGDKEMRARAYAAQTEAGNVFIAQAEWNGLFFDEYDDFPVSKFDDQVDAGSRAFHRLVPRGDDNDTIAAPRQIVIKE